MALHWPTFFTRLGSAVVFCIIMLTGLLWNQWSYLVLIALIQFLCLRDYLRMVRKIYTGVKHPQSLDIVVQGLALIILCLLQVNHEMRLSSTLLYFWPVAVGIPLLLQTKQFPKDARLQALGGMLYIAMPLEMLLLLGQKNMILPIALILMLWTNDTMAYLVGSFIGRTPFSKISPKKTWEGTIGGAVLTMGGAAIYGYYAASYRMADWIVFALCAAVAGTAGDLFESKLKRMANVKDSGTMMPGHGGALDRFDSLLFAAPFAFLYAYIFL